VSTWAVPGYAEWAVPGYAEERELGHGVSGRVVAAVSETTGQRVAIKYLNDNLVRDPEFLGEFRADAERLESLDAPHAASIFDFVELPGGGAAVVTQLVDGVSLRRMLRRGPLGAKAALVVFKDSLLGLGAVHSRRVAHRDVKPDNVLVDADGWCTLTDFGLAVKTGKQAPAAGTPEYMAPELWNGSPYLPATDIYAATVMLCESLAGKPPFTGRAGALREQHELTPVPLDPYDPPLRELIGSGMAKYSDRRPASAREFVSQLDDQAVAAYGPQWEDEGRSELAQRAATALAAPDGGGGSARASQLARRKIVTFASIAAVVMVAVLVGGLLYLSRQPVQIQQVGNVAAANVDTSIGVSPPTAASKCATPTTFTFTGTVTSTDAGSVPYQWVYSTGQTSAVRTLNFTGIGEQSVSSGSVTTSTAGDGWAELKLLLTPTPKVSSQASYTLICSGANSDISVSAKIAPAALYYDSCSAPHPTLTATGTVTAKNAGIVTFYWAMSNGTKTTPVQLIFTKPGTQVANPLTFATWVPSTGSVVLVVTSPAVAASKPAAFNVTCPPPNYGPPAPATSPAAATTSAKASPTPSVTPTTTAPTTTAPTTTAPTTTAPTTTAPTTTAPTTKAPTTKPTTTKATTPKATTTKPATGA
jgi:eukaryotic-like serine/threonine-protein kinase